MARGENGVRHISKCRVCPSRSSEKPRCDLTPWDLAMLSVHYIQKGLLFAKPPPSEEPVIERLKLSLSHTLFHFYPLAGRLSTQLDENGASVFVDCNDAGVDFIHATADITIADILTPPEVPPVVKSLFALDGAVNHDGHSLPLLVVQVTELQDGIFIACSCSHVIVDGTSFWNFFNSWAEISRGCGIEQISRLPIIDRYFLDDSPLRIPSSPDEFIERSNPPPLSERIFHFTSESIAQLKAKANRERNTDEISSFQSLSALMWRSVTRARRFEDDDQKTSCRLATGNRPRLEPPLPPDYFGNSIQAIGATTTVAELVGRDLGWAAWLLHECVISHNNSAVRGYLEAWVRKPFIFHLSGFDACSVKMGSSPRFDIYGNDFGWGRPVAVRSGQANKFDGKITSYPGLEGGGSIDLEVCLIPETMSALQSDPEFIAAITPLATVDA